jgi:integrase
MTVRKRVDRKGDAHWFIDIRYRTADGRKHRFRRDAQINTRGGALAEERRYLTELQRTGEIRTAEPEPIEAIEQAPRHTFKDAVRHYRRTRILKLKPSTKWAYEKRLDAFLSPRFDNEALEDLNGEALSALDLELVKDHLKPSTRRGVQIVFRAVLREAVEAGLLGSMPKLPRFPKVGRKAVLPMHRSDLDLILAKSTENTRLAFALGGFAGLRAGEVRGLRWPDVDLKGGTITVRRSISYGEESTPKSEHHRVIPFGEPLRSMLEAAAKRRASPFVEVARTREGKLWKQGGLNQAFKRAQGRAKLSGWSFHDLRHFFTTELARLGAPAPAIQLLAGHADLATTQRYVDMVASDLRSAVALFAGATAGQQPKAEAEGSR